MDCLLRVLLLLFSSRVCCVKVWPYTIFFFFFCHLLNISETSKPFTLISQELENLVSF